MVIGLSQLITVTGPSQLITVIEPVHLTTVSGPSQVMTVTGGRHSSLPAALLLASLSSVILCAHVAGTGVYALSPPEAAERKAFFEGVTQQLAQPPRANLHRKRKAVPPPQVSFRERSSDLIASHFAEVSGFQRVSSTVLVYLETVLSACNQCSMDRCEVQQASAMSASRYAHRFCLISACSTHAQFTSSNISHAAEVFLTFQLTRHPDHYQNKNVLPCFALSGGALLYPRDDLNELHFPFLKGFSSFTSDTFPLSFLESLPLKL